MKQLMAVTLSFFILVFALCIPTVANAFVDEKTVQGALHADEAVNKAILDSDAGELKKLLTDEFAYVNSSGQLIDKDQYLRDARTIRFDSYTSHDAKGRLYGDTVVVTGWIFANWQRGGGENNGRFRYTRVYVWKQDRWLLAASQITPISGSGS